LASTSKPCLTWGELIEQFAVERSATTFGVREPPGLLTRFAVAWRRRWIVDQQQFVSSVVNIRDGGIFCVRRSASKTEHQVCDSVVILTNGTQRQPPFADADRSGSSGEVS
jgi:hypothetical protein